jgi:hypothetical protein
MSFARWAGELEKVTLSTTFEIPYAAAGGTPVTPDNARAFGQDLAAALHAYLSRFHAALEDARTTGSHSARR